MSEVHVRRKIRCLLFDLGDTLWYRANQENWDRQEGASNQRAGELLRLHTNPALLPDLSDEALGWRLRRDFDKYVHTTIRSLPLLEPQAAEAVVTVLDAWLRSPQTVSSYAQTERGERAPRAPARGDCSPWNASDGSVDDLELGGLLFEALRVRVPDSRPLFADTLPTLAELRERGYLLGIVTNRFWGGEPFYEDLQAIGLLEYFDKAHIAISGDLGIRKPNPRMFEYPLNALQVAPQEAAMIGDSLSADILGAQALGIYAIWKPKSWLRNWALAHAAAQLVQAELRSDRPSLEAFPGIDTADTQLPVHAEPGGALLETDDDVILARAEVNRDYLERFQRGEIKPDRVIGELTELLNIFPRIDAL